MDDFLLVSVATLAIAALVLGILVIFKKRREVGKAKEPNYRAFFIIGATFLPTGIVFMIVYYQADLPFAIGLPLFTLGLVYLIIGLANREKWKDKKT